MSNMASLFSSFSWRREWLGAAWLAVACISVTPALAAAAEPAAAKPAATAPAPETNAPPKVLVIPLSVFTDNPTAGRDPFYPESTRRNPQPKTAPGPVATGTPVAQGAPAAPKRNPASLLVLRGMSGSKSRRLVIINNQTFAQGESAVIQTADGNVRVTCVEIRDKSVVVAVEGQAERKELRLPGEF